jgi:hypothetical protein
LHQDFRRRIVDLREEVRFIPVFGDLFPAIPMEENFINLSLRSEGACRFVAEPVPATRHHGTLEEWMQETSRARMERDISAMELFAKFNKGCILGMPRVGKTTILKHFAFQLLESNANTIVLFLNCRDLRSGNLVGNAARTNLDETLSALALAFLHSGRKPSELNDKESKGAAEVAKDVQIAWQRGQATILIDALDETPS